MKKLGDLLKLIYSDLIRLKKKDENLSFFKISINFFNQRFLPVLIIRLARFFYEIQFLKPISYILVWLNFFLFGIECTPKCKIGPGLFLPHCSGTVIGAQQIGKNATIFQNVTLGAKNADMEFSINQRPTIGDNVMIGAGAKILGPISIANGIKIGANAVVIESFNQENTILVGIPAKQLGSKI